MTAAEAVTLYERVHQLLEQHAALFSASTVDLAQAENLSTEISDLLAHVPAAEHLTGLDDALRARLLAAAQRTETTLATCRTALEHHRHQQLAAHARAERDGAALRHYLPPAITEPARYCDERR